MAGAESWSSNAIHAVRCLLLPPADYEQSLKIRSSADTDCQPEQDS